MKTVTAIVLSALLSIGSGAVLSGVHAETLIPASASTHISDGEIRLMVGLAVMEAHTERGSVALHQLKETYALNLDLQEAIARTLMDLAAEYPEYETPARNLMVGLLSQ